MENQNVNCAERGNPFCDHDIDPKAERASCGNGLGTCYPIKLLTASPSKLHDQTLVYATAKINEVFAAIPPDTEGRRASLLINKVGIVLAWVYHGNAPEGDYCVSSQADEETITEALKLVV